MGSVDRDDDRTLKINFSGDGAAKLRARVSDKLKEFLGDDTDDTLVAYVIVLLRNGRRKQQAKKDLDVFLGDEDSGSFVSWLWDHLSSNLEQYVQSAENHADKAVKTMLPMEKRSGRDESPNHIDSGVEKGKPENVLGNRHKREWKGLVRNTTEPPPLRSSVVDNVCSEEKTHHRTSRRRKSASPDPPQQKKRSRHDERQNMKRESVSQAASAAPRRLLQFAVRDAVGNLRQSVVVKEPSQNRLRSVVSTPSEDLPMEDRTRRLQSIARVPNPMASVLRAVQEAADDVRRVKPTGSVFDRLGRGVDISGTSEQVAEVRDAVIEEEFNQGQEQAHSQFLQRNDYGGQVRNSSMMDCETGLSSDLVSQNEGYNVGHRVVDVSQISTSGVNKGGDPFRVKYSAANNLYRPLPTANTSRKPVNISVNVDTPHYQQYARNATEIDNLKSIQENVADPGKPDVRLMKENNNHVVGNGNAKPPPDLQSQSPKTLPSLPGSYTAGRPSEDAGSRTIFVSNVHFAATKDSLSRHFNKFGEVLKVVILTDAATGQPKGSAFVEFMRKEAADNALSFDGTSFMSRILKITKRSSSNQEAPPAMTWPPRIAARGSPYPPARFARAPYPRGVPGAFRGRPPTKTGARNFQWKRDTQTATDGGGAAAASPGNTLVRNNTYVRPESKQDGSTGTT